MGSRTADEMEQDAMRSMGVPLGKLYSALWQEVAWLFAVWQEYVELYGTKPSRVHLLNQASPLFFRIAQDTMWERTLLHICRVTDRPKTFGTKDNLTIQALPTLIENPDVRRHVTDLIQHAIKASSFCRDWRNRYIAHKDLGIAFGTAAEPLAFASRKCVRQALDAIAAVLNEVSVRLTAAEVRFDVWPNRGGAVSLLHVIDDGLRVQAMRKAKLYSGAPNEYGRQDL
jgi:hypothetical protein